LKGMVNSVKKDSN